MNLIERYIFGRILFLSIGTVIATTFIALTTQVLIYVDLLSTTGQAFGVFMKLASLLIPSLAVVVLPFALLIVAAMTLTTMNTDSELSVIESSGAPGRTIAKPIMIIAAMMALLTLVAAHFVEPWSDRQKRDLISSARGDLFSLAIQSGRFQRIDDDVYVQIAQKEAGGELRGIFVSDRREKDQELLYYARRGVIVNEGGLDLLVMAEGEVHRKEVDSREISMIKFDTYALDLSVFSASDGGVFYFPRERSTAYLLNPDPNDPYFKRKPGAYDREVHRRFSEWLYPLLFGLIAVAFLGRARSNRSEQLQTVATAATIALAFRGLGFYISNSAGIVPIYTALVYALPLSGIAFFTAVVASGKRLTLPKAMVEFQHELASQLFSSGAMLSSRLLGIRPASRPEAPS